MPMIVQSAGNSEELKPGLGGSPIKLTLNTGWNGMKVMKQALSAEDLVNQINNDLALAGNVTASLVKPGKQYFTPSIEDFRIGYEFEVAVKSEPYQIDILPISGKIPKRRVTGPKAKVTGIQWFKHTLTKENKLDNIKKKIDKGEIRVPYLDQEQIESEGWTYIKSNFKDWVFKNNILTLQYLYEARAMYITELSDEGQQLIYKGGCSDINTLRSVIKLLKVN